ncbi:MAG: lasso peptide biosynthesis B2 protein [Marinicellaceae bacterium]
MRFKDYFHAILLISQSRKHLHFTMKKLKHNNFDRLINEKIDSTSKTYSIDAIVKSYFWASRTLPQCHCLPRSIALYQKLNALGFLVEHKFGVNKFNKKLAAHAWVEYENSPLNEPKDLRNRFTVLEKID